MTELENMTLREAVGVLRKRVERNRSIEETARQERERDEAALAALEALVGGRSNEGAETAIGNARVERPRLLGLAAVREVMRESPERVWTPREIHATLKQRGWLSDKAKHPVAGTESAIHRLLGKGEIVKIGRGQYRWPAGQEALTEN